MAGGGTTRPSTCRSSSSPTTLASRSPRRAARRFTFVTDGIESALEQAREAAGGKDVALGGGASVAQQYLQAGLIDEMQLHVVPVLLGAGTRLFENLGDAKIGLECIRVVEAPGVTHLRYRVTKAD